MHIQRRSYREPWQQFLVKGVTHWLPTVDATSHQSFCFKLKPCRQRPKCRRIGFSFGVDGPLELGAPSGKAIVDEVAVVPRFGIADVMGVSKALEWVIDLRDGKRVSIPG